MKNFSKKLFALSAMSIALSACSTFFDKDNTPTPTPLSNFTQTAQIQPVWSVRTTSGIGSEYLKLSPAIANQVIYTSGKDGTVAANDLATGKSLWATRASDDVTSGTAAGDNLVFVGTHEGEVIALQQADGKRVWKTSISSEILAPAAEKNGVVVAKSIDGSITALRADTGSQLWRYQEQGPNLILRAASTPQVSGNSTVVGFENGKLVKLGLQTGGVQWKSTVADPDGLFAIQRMVDIDADPVIIGSRVYAATYQGRIAALQLNSGREIWSQIISSYAGIAADNNKVFVSDARSHVYAFNASNGALSWEQKDLAARNITGPAVMNDYLIVGDGEGYLHVLSKSDGHFVARIFVDRSGILATPIVQNNLVYVYTKSGQLAAYRVN